VPADFAQTELSDAEASQYNIFGAPSGTTLNCETLDSAIHFLAKDSDTLCQQTQLDYNAECCGFAEGTGPAVGGGYPLVGGEPPSLRTPPVNMTTAKTCNVCLDGSNITLPNRTIALGALPVRNCSQLDTLAYTFAASDSQCGNIQLLGPYCGCPVTMRSCSFCPNGEPVPFPDRPFPLLGNLQGLPPGFLRKVAGDLTCGEFQSILDVDPVNNIGIDPGYACLVGQFRSGECGCSQGFQEELVTWLFRVSAFLSLIGSFFILRDVIKKSPQRRTTYHQLIIGTTCFDVITSTAYLLSGLLLPRPAYEAHGTHGTCVLQGILIQLGLTSLFYSVLLSIYYLLMIKYNWKESRFRKYRRYFHLPIITIGAALTAAASTSIAPQLGFCYVAIPPQVASRLRITLLFVVPSSVALVTIFACTLLTCFHVYSKERTTLKWSAKRNLSLTKKVCLQSFLYFVGFAVTIPCVMLNYYGDFRTNNHFGAFAAAAIFAPAQGFLNCLVYFHRASKGSQWNWRKLLGSCWQKGGPASEIPSTEERPSTTTGHTVSVETLESSQDYQPSEVSDMGPSNEESLEQSPHMNVANSVPVTEEIRRVSHESQTDQFSAAAAHWLMDTLDQSDENIHSRAPTRTLRSHVGRAFSRSSMAPNGQSVA
jgi:hypothetical protein